MGEERKIKCTKCQVETLVTLPPNTKSIICEHCLAVIHVTSAIQAGSTSSKPVNESPHPAMPYWEGRVSPSSHPHNSLSGAISLPPPNQQHSPFHVHHHHDPIPSQHPLAQFRSVSMSRTQVPAQPHLQHQSSFRGGATTDTSMLNLPDIVVSEPKTIEDPSVFQNSQPGKPPEGKASPKYPPEPSPSPNSRRPPVTPGSKKPPALSTQGVQLYRHNSASNPLLHSPKLFNAQGTKRAVICGISYRGTAIELKGCLNDAKCMSYLLMSKFRFPESAILVLTEDQMDPRRQPTKYNIMQALEWLVHGCQSGDSLVFHFSGHGSQQPNYKGEELDGFDETLVPVDFMTAGQILDDDINTTIVRPLPTGVDLHAIVDACHSGTVLDLPFLYRYRGHENFAWEDHRPVTGTWKGTAGGNVYSFSGCDDHQTVFDSMEDLGRLTSTGEMTYCFIQAIERGYGSTYGSLLNAMRSAIHTAENQVVTSLIDMLLKGGSYEGGDTQEPQLTSSRCFDVSAPFRL